VVKRTINAVFEPCIDAVLREHGDVVKFAGDGLMMMFTGEGHPLTAARAAMALQAAVRRIGSVSTPAGPARIGVSIGISTGEYLCLLSRVGRLEPVVVGPALDAMFAAEAFARSGQTVVDDALAAVLPAAVLRPVRGSTYRQLRADAPLLAATGGEPVRGRAVRAASDFLEPRVRVAIEDGDTPPEHRSAAIAFLALDGLAAVRAREGDAGLHAHVERFLGGVARACAATDVCWLESDADRDQIRVLLTAGAPYRTDIDEQRMIDAVWRIRTECEGLPVRAGISRGRVFVADVGHPLRRTYNVMGDAVNVAARLAGKAAHGEVLALQTVAGARRSMARVEARAPLSVKGKKAPLAVCLVVGLTVAEEPKPSATTAPMLGRTGELRQLARQVDALRHGRGGVLRVVGEPGMGKSQLVDTALAAWPDAAVRTRGHEFERSTLFGAASRLLREAVGIDVSALPDAAGEQLALVVATSAPELVERLPLIADVARAVVPPTRAVDAVRPEFRLEQTVVAAVALLRAVRPAATVFVADDIDRFDHSSMALLAAMQAATAASPWLVIATSRAEPTGDDDTDGGAVVVVRLGPLASTDVRRLVLQIAGDVGMTKRVVEDIVRHSDGNPMIAHELTLGWATGAREVELPDAVERAVASRIDNLPTAARVLIRDLSVAGVGVELSLARAVLGPRADHEATWTALREYVTRSAGAVQFEREIYAVAAYQGLAHERRRALHRALAVELAARPYARFEAARIAEHAHAGGDQALAWHWSRAAAEVAGSVGAADDAAMHLAHAVEAVDHGAPVGHDELFEVLEALGDAHERVGHPDEAHEAFKRARGLVAVSSPAHLRLYRKHARVAERAGAWTQSLRWVTRGLSEVPADAGAEQLAEQAELELTAAVVRFFQGKLKPAVELARGAAATAERAGSRRAVAQAELQLEMCCSELGLPERAAHGLRALELFELLDDHLGLANLRLNLGVSCYNEARWDQALHHYGRSIVEYDLVGDQVGAAATTNNRAEILTDQGRDVEALDALEEARRGLKAANYRIGVAITSSGLGRLATRRGDAPAAAAWLAEARNEFVALDAAQLVADTDVRLIELDVWRGDLKAALRAMPRVRAFVAETGPSPVLAAGLARLEAWATLGPGLPRDARARTRARKVWNGAIAAARREGFPYEVALAIDGYVVSVGDDALERERDDLFHRMGVVSPPRPPWLTTV
ncbi:MAG: hypothetical protein RJA49_3161, partial [Actinomycetota bacterium]